ncbi:MAG: ATP-binding protein [Proteobacteria bacterium]|nr:ATP-binding protein [Pseudomonadota bacterium]
MNKRKSVDKTKASRDGHEFHENWAARKALQLLWPKDELIGIAMEGLHPADQKKAVSETVEIADVTLYHGKRPTFKGSNKVVIVQLKYSISDAYTPFRNSHAKKTIKKFAKAYKDFKNIHNERETNKKVKFELVTNRPIYQDLIKAIKYIAEGKTLTGETKKQADQFITACEFKGKELIEFAKRVSFTGLAGNLSENKRDLSMVLADWSGANDHVSRSHLGSMKQLLRDKAGIEGESNNVIKLVDVLSVLEVAVEDLFPCPDSFPNISGIVVREQLSTALKLISETEKPFLIHAAGGVGKTVFLQSIAKSLSDLHEVVLFDCFGGGAYRAPEDARHLPKKAFSHIVNNLASKGLCDPLIPINNNTDDLVKVFRKRLTQAAETLQRISSDKKIILFIDAIDNSADIARDKNQDSFAKELLKSIEYNQSIPNVTLVLSCRTERRELSKDNLSCQEYKLEPFSLEETKVYLQKRTNKLTSTEIEVAQARSGGNPRVLEHLVLSDRGLLDKSEINNVIELDDLLESRIDDALKMALRRGYTEDDINAFLAGLSVLPPPVPIEEYAAAQEMEVSEIESFIADLAPLLEKTKQGVWFRDEPTETLVRKKYASNEVALKKVSENLFMQQTGSVYAARSLPGLLLKRGDGDKLFELAFDERFPQKITSIVGKQAIRYSRLKAAISQASYCENYNQLVRLLVELSTIEAVNQKGGAYLLDNPDLIIASQDIDATRRLFELRTSWQGTRHARLAIAYILSGDHSEAYRHGVKANEWINHYYEQDDKYRRNSGRCEAIDIAAVPLCILSQGNSERVISWMRRWKAWYAFKVSKYLFTFINQSKLQGSVSAINSDELLEYLTDEIGVIAGALSFYEYSSENQEKLIKKLAVACKEEDLTKVENDNYTNEIKYNIQDGLFKATSIALSKNLKHESRLICSVLKPETPSLWSFNENYYRNNITPFIIYTAINSLVNNYELSGQDILPKELAKIWPVINRNLGITEFEKQLKLNITESIQENENSKDNNHRPFSYETKRDAEKFLNDRFQPLTQLAQSFSALLSTTIGNADKEFLDLIQSWSDARKTKGIYDYTNEFNRFFNILGRELVIFFLWSRCDLSVSSMTKFWIILSEENYIEPNYLNEVVSILAKQGKFHELAGEISVKVRSLIEEEDDVDTRAMLYSRLSRAILPASVDEATEYFRNGLDQMDVIGSGDYSFTNELMLFACNLKGQELKDKDFHTLTNIYELNMGEDPHKISWDVFTHALSKTAGCKGFAKLSRWDDRDKVNLKCTLMPFFIALIKDDKIEANLALPLLRLCENPYETWYYDMSHLAEAIDEKQYSNEKELFSEFFEQYEEDNPSLSLGSEVEKIYEYSLKIFGNGDKVTSRLLRLKDRYTSRSKNLSDYSNHNNDRENKKKRAKENREQEEKIKALINDTIPTDELSLSSSVDKLNKLNINATFESKFLKSIRSKVNYSERAKYIQILSRLENLFFYRKLEELKACKKEWSKSSNALHSTFNGLDSVFYELQSDEFISHERLSNSNLKDVAKLCNCSDISFAMGLIKTFIVSDTYIPASVWLSFASILCKKSDDGIGQTALVRLLNSNAAKLAESVIDGKWEQGTYPSSDPEEIAASLVWLKLGSPLAADRWSAAHSIRRFAKLNRWDVIDLLVSKIKIDNAHPFQAPELIFYKIYARLWLLIALARVAIDYPKKVSKYIDIFKEISLDIKFPHILIRHFAKNIIKTCVKNDDCLLSAEDNKKIDLVNKSLFPLLKETRKYKGTGTRPDNIEKPEFEFSLEYDFNKVDVSSVGYIFNKYGWEMNDVITKWARTFDNKIDGMYDSGGREKSFGQHYSGMSSNYHTYGQQLGWNALYLTTGQLLSESPVLEDIYEDDPWANWMNRETLTRNDGLWLSDGIDITPLDTKIKLLTKNKKKDGITGDKDIILSLIGMRSSKNIDKITVNGGWHSFDGISVRISSALVKQTHTKNTVTSLAKESPFHVWLPSLQEDEDIDCQKEKFEAWLICPSTEAKLDKHDTLGASSAMERPYFTNEITQALALKSTDPFNRQWEDGNGKVLASAEAWGYTGEHNQDNSESGVRLSCSKELLKKVLNLKNMDLVILIKLEKYKQSSHNENSSFTHTTAILSINKNMEYKFTLGKVNHLHKSDF